MSNTVHWTKVDLARLSGGSGRRAAAILIVAHVIPGVIALGLWALGLLPIFDNVRWLVTTIVVAFAVLSALWMFLAFGFWGTIRTWGVGHGEEYEQTFSTGVGFALGWLRWFMQIVMVAVLFVPLSMTWLNMRWWHLAGTEELDALPSVAQTIPAMPDWELLEVEATETGFPGVLDSTMTDPDPEGVVQQTYAVPDSFTFEDLQAWLAGPTWAQPETGEPFGPILVEYCRPENNWCNAQRVPAQGQPAEYFLRATFEDANGMDESPQVIVRLHYRQYVEPDYDVSQETVQRAKQLPIPDDWTVIDEQNSTNVNGEEFTRRYTVPDSFEAEDLQAWFQGPVWTDPAQGEPFGALQAKPCREVDSVDPPSYLCSAIVADTLREPGRPVNGPVEVVRATLAADHTVRVTLERNG